MVDVQGSEQIFSTGLVREAVTGKLAAVKLGKLWYRVKLLQKVVGKSQANGRLVDKGGLVIVTVEDLRELPARFVSLPSQAVCVQLAGLLSLFKAGVLASYLGRVRELFVSVVVKTQLSVVCFVWLLRNFTEHCCNSWQLAIGRPSCIVSGEAVSCVWNYLSGMNL